MANKEVVINGFNHLVPSLANDSDDDHEFDVDSPVNGHNGVTNGTAIDDRIKRRAKRPSTKLVINTTAAVNGVNGLQVLPNGESGDKVSPKINGNSFGKKWLKNSRRSRGRFGRGLAKKGGAGGKGTWGRPGSELVGVEEGLEDPHDPNYDSESEDVCKFEAITPPLEENEIETTLTPILNEYFENGDTEEVGLSLEEINLGDNLHQILVIAVTLAMERKASNREMTSVLISDLYGRVLHEENIERGFDILISSLPDLVLDTPNAAIVLGNFIARAVADDCIPPKFVQRYKGVGDCTQARMAIEHADVLLSMKHGLVRLDNVWGVSGGMRPVKYLIKQIQSLLKEYLSSGDIEEATRCLQELEVPHFYHEFVYEAIVLTIEDMGERTMDLICELLKSLCSSVIITLDQLRNGFYRVYQEMSEICIDVPHAYNILEKFAIKCQKCDFLPSDVVKNLPSRGRKRFVSEGDGGRVKEELY
ncbi:programmed cell death protein 4-like [Oppia nitens]|uniref:programmed cell death protein 4-like n=1 Tax=Oppia nitens TaxID=1686743 RepID=UPI0023DC36F9|nr:programmed cell death protein 4-like [Oppia nitens]